jgi:predicted nucleic acid-binding protein
LVIVDTTVWIGYLCGEENRETLRLKREQQRQRLALTDLILCEILQGITTRKSVAQVQADLFHFNIFETGGIDLAVATAHNYRALRVHGSQDDRLLDSHILSPT